MRESRILVPPKIRSYIAILSDSPPPSKKVDIAVDGSRYVGYVHHFEKLSSRAIASFYFLSGYDSPLKWVLDYRRIIGEDPKYVWVVEVRTKA
ncbi:MAG: hypothetical protein DSO07_01050 [Thermoproteota archaeon]|uniref:Uncharacterized protein n=1 Tax=Candidatus Methanodesulfokora washburnensis TaxID=2478471 RepID=A0A3R9PTY7_9CREN|nr:hypothetical protein [Candidatus Methanodesulfokores washburnensis]RSN72964.1 hypothetical protein D6D85_11780 [Candidatus Methanodesulfokores washburnensis]TDA42102.1 MAG: hypothetical protein DSO07_01050 [Candidatus Korarchaeota archaeon]